MEELNDPLGDVRRRLDRRAPRLLITPASSRQAVRQLTSKGDRGRGAAVTIGDMRIRSTTFRGTLLERGFTLIELMVTITVLAILVAVGLPNLREFLAGNRLSSQVNGFIGFVSYARSEAIVRNQDVVVCPKSASTITCASTTTWNTNEVQAFVDVDGNGQRDAADVLLKTIPAADPSDAQIGFTQASSAAIIFGSAGFARAERAFKIFMKSDDAAYQARLGRTICISRVGRVRVTEYSAASCPDF